MGGHSNPLEQNLTIELHSETDALFEARILSMTSFARSGYLGILCEMSETVAGSVSAPLTYPCTMHIPSGFRLRFYPVIIFSLLLTFWLSPTAWGQNNRADFQLRAQATEQPLTLDGLLDEDAWKSAEVAANFFRILPIDTGYASAQSEVRVCYDDEHVYFAIVCHDTVPGKRPVESLRRDFSFGKNDNFLLFIDTYNDQTNGFSFGASAAGAQWDGLQANGGFVSLDWDCKWYSATQNYPDRWVVEMAIPFKSIRYAEGVREWGINFSRLDLKQNEKSSWAPVPRQFQSANLAFTGTLVFDSPPPKTGTHFSLIPYAAGRVSKDFEKGEDADWGGDVGADAKITLSTSLNLDLTVNPDFSQVEVDQQVTNLSRFELFFPERRQFFLENSDLFANLGATGIRPFFSRRIGLDSPVQAGARLSGKLNENWRIGLMNMQTGSRDEVPAANYAVGVVQRKLFSRSYLSAFMVNKEAMPRQGDTTYTGNPFNRVAGMDLNLATPDNRWNGKVFYHQSFGPENAENDFVMAGTANYETQQLAISWNQAWVGQDYQAEVGFIQRKGYHQLNPEISYRFFPSSDLVANHGPNLTGDYIFNPSFDLTDREIEVGYAVQFLNRSSALIEWEIGYLKLLAPFDPTNTGGDSLATGSEYNWNELSLEYSSNARTLFTYALGARYGGYFNGDRIGFNGELTYRVQPYGSLALAATYNNITLPAPYSSAELFLIGPKLDLTFTDKLFLTTFVQYNNQIDNININARFQWRYAPVSDLFIVYTDNYLPDRFQVKNRALVLKLSYWLN